MGLWRRSLNIQKVGKFLLNNGSGIVNTLGDALPSNGVLGIVKGLIDKD